MSRRNSAGLDMSGQVNIVYSEEEAAKQLGLSGRTLQRLRVDGDGPPYIQLTGRRIGYADSDLREWVAARRVASTSAAGR